MIQIKRGPPPDIAAYVKKSVKAPDGRTKVTRAEREVMGALTFFTDTANYLNNRKLTKKPFPFAVYKDPELAKALEAVFEPKCAYCESHFAAVTPKEIEHFRPKSEVDTGAGVLRPGYFWLAAEWENLLISCVDCNRARQHDVPGQPNRVTLGKATQFPLSDETLRVRALGSVAAEEPARLLLHPCIDQPEEHLSFDVEGLVRPRLDSLGNPSERGKVSITVYALQRKGLVEARLKVLTQLRLQLNTLGYLVTERNTLKALGATHAVIDANGQQIAAVRDSVRAMLARNAPYLAMVREWIREAHVRGEFAHLMQFGIDLRAMI
jgi:uncharacterized protein (TIGR02646 family)